MRRLLVFFALVFFVLQLFFVATQQANPSLALASNILQDLLGLCAVIGFWIVYAKVEKRFDEEKKGWLCIALAFSLFFIADVIWTVFEAILHINPIGSVPDFFYLLAYLVLMWGMYYFISSMFFRSQALNCAIGGLTFIIAGLFFYMNILQNVLVKVFSWASLIQESYGFFDILLLGLVLILIIPLIVSHNRLLRSWLLFGMGIIALAVFDLAFSEFAVRGMYYSGHPIDIVYCLAYLLFVFAAYYKLKLLKNDNPHNH
ncbi:Uncharacterised protein [uncultured archaeon]|nr:Uncharacterised protein [uncultured archaeon]